MDAHRARLGYHPPIPLIVVSLLVAFGYGCEKTGGRLLRSPPAVLTTPQVAYTGGAGGGIHLLDTTTGQITDFPAVGTDAQGPAISPDGTRIAFTRFQPIATPHVLTMAVDGSDIRTCTSDTASWDISPHWSPDGRRLAFTRTPRNAYLWDIYTVRSDGSDLRRVTTDGRSHLLDWSPDGNRLLFARADTLTRDVIYHTPMATLATIAPDGTDTRVLFQETVAWFSGGDYSPDASHIVIADSRIPPHLKVLNADGSNPHPLPDSTSFGSLDRCSWSPNGSAIIFSGMRYIGDAYRLWVLPLGAPRSEAPFLGSLNYVDPDWGPKP